MLDFSVEFPIDQDKALEALKNKNKKSVYYQILERFRNTNVIATIDQLNVAINNNNHTKFKEAAQSFKGSSGTVGAGILHYNCYFIQDSFIKKELTFMRERYNRLVEDAIDFLIYSKELIEKEDD